MNISSSEIIIPVLTFLSVVTLGGLIMFIQANRKKSLAMKMLQHEDALPGQTGEGDVKKKDALLEIFEKIGNFVSHGQTTTTLSEQLIRAGYHSKSASAMYTGVKMLLFFVGMVMTACMVINININLITKMTLIFVGGVVFFFLPNAKIMVQFKKRSREINRYLPEAIDLLEICVSSGIGLDMAWNIVSNEIKQVCPILAGAMDISNFEMHLGASRVTALKHMAARTGVDALSSLAAILVQTERFGTSIGSTLQVFATSMREERNFAVEENAEKMAVKLIIPMVLFIFPAAVITVVGPAAIVIAKVMMTQ
ncbi:MAG: type II secretion system F family protein [Sedimentisphaerales bacterium]|nr:type II secretion system F family protein [Sedimentisphaerales bacterium]